MKKGKIIGIAVTCLLSASALICGGIFLHQYFDAQNSAAAFDELAGLVVEAASGMSFQNFLQTRIFTPLGMTETGFTVRDDQKARLTACYNAKPGGGIRPATNHCGGIQGGISNGETIFFRVAFKPVSTISLPQNTAAFDGTPVAFAAKGRHDPCVLPRAVPVVEAMAALVLADAFLQQQVQRIPHP